MNLQATLEGSFHEEVEIAGHIIDSLLLPKVLDEIINLGGKFEILSLEVGQRRHQASRARLRIEADSAPQLEKILKSVARHGATSIHTSDCDTVTADMDGAFPEQFYATTNQRTEVRINGQWITVENPEMDCGIVLKDNRTRAACIAMLDVRKGDEIVVGRRGVRVTPEPRDIQRHDTFSFMNSAVSSEKPKGVTVRDIAQQMRLTREHGGKILFVGGPAIVHTGSRDHLSALIREGYVQVLFAGNALATHDLEQSLYGTSLGISMQHGRAADEGHEHHLRTINRIRRLGSIANAVEQGVITSGIMYECVKHHVPFVLAGSIRDDGPLPDVITDSVKAQEAMRAQLEGVTFCLMLATTLHSIAVGNLLPAYVKVVCVDINPATATKLTDRGSFQTVGVVTDVEPFLRILMQELLEKPAK
ncbi:MAG: TIGR00300 family protein [Planctomycetales bacterium]